MTNYVGFPLHAYSIAGEETAQIGVKSKPPPLQKHVCATQTRVITVYVRIDSNFRGLFCYLK